MIKGALYINKQTEAEKDDFLLGCFHDNGTLQNLVESSYTIVAGRKGTGKTAIARYLENNTEKYGIDFAYRLSIRNFNTINSTDEKTKLDSILFYIVIKTVQKMLNFHFFDNDHTVFWKDFLLSNGLQQVSDYATFAVTQKTNKVGFSLRGLTSWLPFVKGEAKTEGSHETHKERVTIAQSPSSLYDSLRQTVSTKESIIVFIDDISDYLDESKSNALNEDINVIKDLLLALQTYNLSFLESGLKVRFVALVREDLFEFMGGSNINKLKSDSLSLQWNEKDFASLVIKRLPYYQTNLEKHLKDPVSALRERFPDEIFNSALEQFSTNRHQSNFYAYMVAVSFNRPRDFLQFCYALRERLSMKTPATWENIDMAEIEYSNYFIQELRDELYIASRVFHYDLTEERINHLVDLLSHKNGFNSSELKTDLAHFLNEKTSIGKKKIEMLLGELWRYGVIGVSDKSDKIIRFKYLSNTASFTAEKIKTYTFFLHRGLWWFAKKRKDH